MAHCRLEAAQVDMTAIGPTLPWWAPVGAGPLFGEKRMHP
jgi:hypothetical protein